MKPISDQSLSDEKSRHCSTLYRVQKYGDGRPINQSGVVRPPVSHLIKINAADVPVFRGHRVSAGFSPLSRGLQLGIISLIVLLYHHLYDSIAP